ncbi:peptidylprolyl isomerase [Mangrovimonas yunxiaonensis]|uniref:peptidylprolyl isomerase n=1 Tax=Mangrovimonas yunxiaonensis TaxID=1197477 RepID=A0A084TNL0_9FLAO|nr:peptidylprolyl isomerase [Mangrovimonas yunxiaonensis]KFB02296.1 peptidylprolyl isomerase [Mangrovimonas yunxiaonensis]GGH39506.1 peptidylprolyl isomerase [Mangrovimonas yunxiaonensis]
MRNFNQVMKLLVLALLVSFTSCGQKYPDLEDGLYAEFVTNKGTMVAKLFYKEVPVTVSNFVALAEGTHPQVTDSLKGKPYYNGIIFHRVIDQFMIQAGDPTATGAGGPGYEFADEFHPDLKHDKPGMLSMANAGPATNGSQFFITEKATPSLDAFKPDGTLKKCGAFPGGGCHAVFGELVLGLDVQDSISNVKTGARNKPEQDVVIQALNIIRKGSDAQAFNAAQVFEEEAPKLAEKLQAQKEAAQKKLKEEASAAAERFLEANKDLGEVKKLDTGVVMIFTEKGNGEKPNASQSVLIDCAGYFEDGKLFYTTMKDVAQANDMYNETSDKKGAYQPFAKVYNESAGLIPGFREAMLNMKIGDKVKVFIPSFLGYGESGSGPIQPNTNLIFEINLVGIEK